MRRAAALRLALRALATLEQSGQVTRASETAKAFTTVFTTTADAGDHSSRVQLARRTPPPWSSYSTTTNAPSHEGGPLKTFRLAQTGEGLKEAELLQWFVREGDWVEAFGRLCEVQSDKATVELTSPYAGVVQRLHHGPGDTVPVGGALADIYVAADEPGGPGNAQQPAASAARTEQPHAAPLAGAPSAGAGVQASPAVRRIAAERGVDLTSVVGTGPGGRVTRDDLEAFLREDQVGISAAASPPAAAAAAAAGAGAGDLQTVAVPLRGYRKAMARSMALAGQVPHFHFCDEVQMDALVALREQLRGGASLRGAKLTYLPFFIKAAALSLRDFPSLNASLSPDGGSLLQHGAVNIGVAMATPHGLAVPNIKGCQALSVAEIAAELARLQAAAAGNSLRAEDVAGGTFTLSNVGTLGGWWATPLVHPPQVGIMAFGRVRREPRVVEGAPGGGGGSIAPAWVMGLSLGADHRVVDGATLAGFAGAWRAVVERPGSMLLHLR